MNGSPWVSWECWEVRPLWHLDQLDAHHRPKKFGDIQRYWRMERGDEHAYLDRTLPHEAWRLEDRMVWRFKGPLWLADMERIPETWRLG